MKFLITFTLVDYQRSRRTALVLANSKGQAHRVLIQSLEDDDLENLSKIQFQRMDNVLTMGNMVSPNVLAVIY
jgi:hypothetical protein